MTGTALTEATEFMKIYHLQVVEVPTNRPMVRDDQNDEIYKTKDGKWAAVAREIAERHAAGQPVLVGTISVEVSELLSAKLRERGIPHAVLNAKPEFAEREGATIAEAGRSGAVTIATNMAGRGVDIKLGGNPEHLTHLKLVELGLGPDDEDYDAMWEEVHARVEEEVERDRARVMEAGGLYILGTERHESRRIDNQLRGRSGRQGDPGESRFYLSAEDDLVRLFAGDRIYRILDRLGSTTEEGEEEPIASKMLSKQIESAQKKVEEQNFLIRKRVLEYDDVMNQQRDVIYDYRDRILEGEDISEAAREQIALAVERTVHEYLPGDFVEEDDVGALFTQLEQLYPVALAPEDLDANTLERGGLVEELKEDVIKAYEEREEELGTDLMRALERFVLLQIIDDRWREHLHDMDYLREGIHLRGFAQIDPLVAYKNEGFEMFTQLMNGIWEEFARYIFHVEVEVEPTNGHVEPDEIFDPSAHAAPSALQYAGGTAEDQPSALREAAKGSGVYGGVEPAGALQPYGGMVEPPPHQPVTVQTRHADVTVGRNEPCPCGSGKKYKKCHGA
jgi:preprotein translocase subunit SecA